MYVHNKNNNIIRLKLTDTITFTTTKYGASSNVNTSLKKDRTVKPNCRCENLLEDPTKNFYDSMNVLKNRTSAFCAVCDKNSCMETDIK